MYCNKQLLSGLRTQDVFVLSEVESPFRLSKIVAAYFRSLHLNDKARLWAQCTVSMW